MSEHAEVNVSELYDRFLSAGVDGSLSKTAEAPPTAEQVASRVASPQEGEEGKTKTAKAKESGENLEQAGDASSTQEVTPGSPKPLDTEDVPESPGGIREESPKTIEKQASEVFEGIDEHVKARYEDEKALRKYASEVIDTMKKDMETYQRQSDLSGLAGAISERIGKKAAADPDKEDDEGKETKPEPKKDKGEKESAAAPAVAEPPAEGATSEEAVVPAAPSVPAGAPGAGTAIPMEELPEDIRAELETLVSDLAEQTGLPPEQVLEQLNQISEEQFGDVSPEELTGELSKAAAEVEYDELSQRMRKLSAELGMEDTPEESDMESSPEEAAGSETSVEGEDDMAAALLEGRSQEELDALQEAVQELEAQNVPPDVIEEAVVEVLSGDIPEEVSKVASDDDWNSLEPKQKVVGVLAYSLANAGRK